MNTVNMNKVAINYKSAIYECDDHNFEILGLLGGKKNETYLSGNGVNKSAADASKAAIGEYIERTLLYDYNDFINDNDIKGYSLLNGNIIHLNNKDILEANLFCDSSGLSCHTNSIKSINGALNEFIERQSFIFNYLSKNKGQEILPNTYLKYINLTNIIYDIKFYNISIIPRFFVIFAYLDKGDDIWIGLGADQNLKQALLQAVKEIYQFYYNRLKTNKKDKYKNKKITDYTQVYSILEPCQIRKAFEYLNKSDALELECTVFSASRYEIIKTLYKVCKIEPYIFYTNTSIQSNVKCCHIIDFNWFPSLLPKMYSNKVYDFVENNMGVKLDRKCTIIPFP